MCSALFTSGNYRPIFCTVIDDPERNDLPCFYLGDSCAYYYVHHSRERSAEFDFVAQERPTRYPILLLVNVQRCSCRSILRFGYTDYACFSHPVFQYRSQIHRGGRRSSYLRENVTILRYSRECKATRRLGKVLTSRVIHLRSSLSGILQSVSRSPLCTIEIFL